MSRSDRAMVAIRAMSRRAWPDDCGGQRSHPPGHFAVRLRDRLSRRIGASTPWVPGDAGFAQRRYRHGKTHRQGQPHPHRADRGCSQAGRQALDRLGQHGHGAPAAVSTLGRPTSSWWCAAASPQTRQGVWPRPSSVKDYSLGEDKEGSRSRRVTMAYRQCKGDSYG